MTHFYRLAKWLGLAAKPRAAFPILHFCYNIVNVSRLERRGRRGRGGTRSVNSEYEERIRGNFQIAWITNVCTDAEPKIVNSNGQLSMTFENDQAEHLGNGSFQIGDFGPISDPDKLARPDHNAQIKVRFANSCWEIEDVQVNAVPSFEERETVKDYLDREYRKNELIDNLGGFKDVEVGVQLLPAGAYKSIEITKKRNSRWQVQSAKLYENTTMENGLVVGAENNEKGIKWHIWTPGCAPGVVGIVKYLDSKVDDVKIGSEVEIVVQKSEFGKRKSSNFVIAWITRYRSYNQYFGTNQEITIRKQKISSIDGTRDKNYEIEGHWPVSDPNNLVRQTGIEYSLIKIKYISGSAQITRAMVNEVDEQLQEALAKLMRSEMICSVCVADDNGLEEARNILCGYIGIAENVFDS
ncbi:unnamed protein product [Caenorhabditis auriculariae]|uniref:Uncharacterized protein n=1 Tax=Caenorhabditis auriculariae TaxID=2777116 RepID=A0A8S1H0K7_9PELO|nr:unnamed protein product [Caenorhabditis auriculariae]